MLDGEGDRRAQPLRQEEPSGDSVPDPDSRAVMTVIAVAARHVAVRGVFADIVEQHRQIDGRVGRGR